MPPRGDYIELTSPGEPPRRLPLRGARVGIGRAAGNDLQLSGGYVSRRHARLERSPEGTWRAIDLGSSNGTFVNNRRAEVATLNDGDVISLGPHRLVLHAAGDLTATSFGASDVEIVPSDEASIVVDRASLRGDRMIPARVLSRLHDAGRRLSRCPDITGLLTALAQEFCGLLRPKRVAIGREDGEQCTWPVVVDALGRDTDGADLTQLLVPRVNVLEGSIAMRLDALKPLESTMMATASANSILFPIKAGERRLGHVYVEFEQSRRPAHEETTEFLSLLSRQAALVWENLELQGARRDADELNRELSAARQIQLQLFPNSLRLDPRLEIAAENVPALGVSGDYYDFRLVAPGRLMFIIADVMGHGLSAALLMSGVQALFRTGVQAGWDLPTLDRHLNDAVEASGSESFVTGLIGFCDVNTHTMSLLCAGHPWPSLCHGRTSVERVDAACSYPWGSFAERDIAPSQFQLPPGDWSLVAYTDGLTEAPLPNGGQYGAERLCALHLDRYTHGADDLCEAILNDVLAASDDSLPQQDDFTLLVLRGLPTA